MHLQFCGIGIGSTNPFLTCIVTQCAGRNQTVTGYISFLASVLSCRIWMLLVDIVWLDPLPGGSPLRYCLFLQHIWKVLPSPCHKVHGDQGDYIPFFMNRHREYHSGHELQQGSFHHRFPPCRHHRVSLHIFRHILWGHCNGAWTVKRKSSYLRLSAFSSSLCKVSGETDGDSLSHCVGINPTTVIQKTFQYSTDYKLSNLFIC